MAAFPSSVTHLLAIGGGWGLPGFFQLFLFCPSLARSHTLLWTSLFFSRVCVSFSFLGDHCMLLGNRMEVLACTSACVHKHTEIHTQTYRDTQTHPHRHTSTTEIHKDAHRDIHVQTDIHTDTKTHTDTHTDMQTHTCLPHHPDTHAESLMG